jgi:hypothetical protein
MHRQDEVFDHLAIKDIRVEFGWKRKVAGESGPNMKQELMLASTRSSERLALVSLESQSGCLTLRSLAVDRGNLR